MDIPIRSGNSFIDAVFDMCVRLLLLVGKISGLSYNTVNVLFFCVVWPVFTICLLVALMWRWRKNEQRCDAR